MPNGHIILVWGDGEHAFNIAPLKVALELEEKCGAGVAVIFERIRRNSWFVNDLRETIRLGLVGAGLEPVKALALVVRYFDGRPWQEGRPVAMQILMAAMIGVPGDSPGKTPAEREREAASIAPTAASSAPPSTASAPPSDFPRAPSTR